MSDASVLREYLVSLGFKVDESGQKKFNTGLGKLDATAKGLSKSLVGVATAANTMVAIFSMQMEKLYYSAKRADTTVGSLQAMSFGAGQVGISADRMRGSLEGMARAIRSNPGLTGLLNSLGVKVTGRDKADVMVDLVTQLKKMPFAVAERYANMFGIDSDTLFMLQEGLDKMKEARDARKQMAAEMGIDTEKAAEAGKEYANAMREIYERVGLLKDALAIKLLPAMKEFAGVTIEILKDWTRIINTWQGGGDFLQRMREGVFGRDANSGVQLSADSKSRLAAMGSGAPTVATPASPATPAPNAAPTAAPRTGAGMTRGIRNNNPGNLNFAGQPGATREGGPNGRFAVFGTMQEGKDALAKQLLRYQARGKDTIESIINTYAPSSENDTQAYIRHMERTTGKKGNEKIDLRDEKFRATFMDGIIAHENGKSGFEAYKRLGGGGAATAGGASVNQTNNITVNGVSDPAKAAAAVGESMKTANADLIRSNKLRVQ